VDEPTAGLSPKLALKIYDLLVRLKKNGAAVLMVDQNVKYAIQYSDRLYVMVNGYITTEYSGKILSSSLKEIVNSWFKHG
jgi:branched-chain amino acid transport system ATP-binding protein